MSGKYVSDENLATYDAFIKEYISDHTSDVNHKMDRDGSNADSEVTFDGAFTVGFRTTAGSPTVGVGSVAIGTNNIASGANSHAEGTDNVAVGINSHAEGSHTTAMAHSHTEGYYTQGYGVYSHAEGYRTYAYGDASHAEGRETYASDYSHAEGNFTTAIGTYSHAEGEHTCAGMQNQTVVGKYNNNKLSTLFEVGNGNSENRNNAFEVYNNGEFSQDNGTTKFKFTRYNNEDGYYDGSGTFHAVGSGGTGGGSVNNAYKIAKVGNSSITANGEDTLEFIAGDNVTLTPDTTNKTIRVDTAIPTASTSTLGGVKVDGSSITIDANGIISSSGGGGGSVNNAYKIAKVGNTSITANGEDTLEFIAGSNVTLTPDSTNKTITIASSGGSGGGMNTDGSNAANLVEFSGAFTVGNRVNGSWIGINSTSEGLDNVANGDYAHAEGVNTTAYGNGSHSEGFAGSGGKIIAVGLGAHAEGCSTTHISGLGNGNPVAAYGSGAHAEGISTYAYGKGCHAEGILTTAKGLYSHAEGHQTSTSGYESHAEGDSTTAADDQCHAEGSYTYAGGQPDQHVGGRYNNNKSDTLFEIGNGSSNYSRLNIFEVYDTGHISQDDGTSKFKFTNVNGSDGYYDGSGTFHAFGSGGTSAVNNAYKIVKVNNTNLTASGEDTLELIAGNNITLTPDSTNKTVTITATGGGGGGGMNTDGSNAANNVTFSGSFTVGNRISGSTIGANSVTEGIDNFANGNCSHAEGYQTCALGNATHTEGSGTTASTQLGTSHTFDYSEPTHAEGLQTYAFLCSHAEGCYTTAGIYYDDENQWIDYGYSDHAEGYETVAGGSYSHAEGEQTTALGEASHSEGYLTCATGDYSHAEGLETCAAYDCQHVQGSYNINKANTLFEIGNGYYDGETGNIHYGNAFEVYKDGYISQDDGTSKFKFTAQNGVEGYINNAGTFHSFHSLTNDELYTTSSAINAEITLAHSVTDYD